MRAYLHADFELRGNILCDRYLGARYTLSPDAMWLARRLGRDNRLESLAQTVAADKGLSAAEAQATILSFYTQLGGLGAVRGVWDREYAWLLRLRATAGWNRRFRGTAKGFSAAMLWAYAVFVLLGTALFAAPVFFGVLPGWSLALPAYIFASCAAHEAGHAGAARLLGLPVVLLARFGYTAVVYMPPKSNIAAIVAAAGPIAGAVCCLALGVIVPAWWIFVAVAACHAACLLPWTADGCTLWRAMRRSRG